MSLPCSFSVLSFSLLGSSRTIPAKWSSCFACIPIFENPAHPHSPSCFVWLSHPKESSLSDVFSTYCVYWFPWLLTLYSYCFSEMFHKYHKSWFPKGASKPHGDWGEWCLYLISNLAQCIEHRGTRHTFIKVVACWSVLILVWSSNATSVDYYLTLLTLHC